MPSKIPNMPLYLLVASSSVTKSSSYFSPFLKYHITLIVSYGFIQNVWAKLTFKGLPSKQITKVAIISTSYSPNWSITESSLFELYLKVSYSPSLITMPLTWAQPI